jgi:asparagine synthase (glutamine-hydrolysing)
MYIASTLMAQQHAHQMQAFHVFFDDERFSEHALVEETARAYQMPFRSVRLSADLLAQHMDDIVRGGDNLELLPTVAGMFFLSRLAGEHCKVVLSGVGGDELFFGYPTYRATALRARLGRLGRPLHALRHVSTLLPNTGGYLENRERLERFTSCLQYPPELAHLSWRYVFQEHEITALVPDLAASRADVLKPQLRYFEEADALGYTGLDRFRYVDTNTWLIDCGLSMWDKLGMYSSIEIRVPFLDLDVMRRISTAPLALRARGLGSKWLLKQIGRERLPEQVLRRPKQGFQVPVSRWLRGALQERFRAYTYGLPRAVFSHAEIDRLWSRFTNGREDTALRLWVLGCLSLWCQQREIAW